MKSPLLLLCLLLGIFWMASADMRGMNLLSRPRDPNWPYRHPPYCYPMKDTTLKFEITGFANPRQDECPYNFCYIKDNDYPKACLFNLTVQFDKWYQKRILREGCGKSLTRGGIWRGETKIRSFRNQTINDVFGPGMTVVLNGESTATLDMGKLTLGVENKQLIWFPRERVYGYVSLYAKSETLLLKRSCAIFDWWPFYEVDDIDKPLELEKEAVNPCRCNSSSPSVH